MLKSKLFILTTTIISLSLLLSGIVYYKNINAIFDEQSQVKINHDIKMFNSFLDSKKEQTKKLITDISNSENLKLSLNLISNYEDPKNYTKETFDYEKANLLNTVEQWIKLNENYSLSLYNKNKELILINRKIQNSESIGFFSYDEKGSKYFIDKNDINNKIAPKYIDISKYSLNEFHTILKKDAFLIFLLKEVKIENEVIGYLKICFYIDSKVLDSIQNRFINDFALKSNDTYILTSNIESIEEIKNSKDHSLDQIRVLYDTNSLYLVNIIDKTEKNKRLKNSLNTIIFIWIVILIVTLFISYFFTNTYILKPIQHLQDLIKKIKKNNNLEIKNNTDININTTKEDEIQIITDEFNFLSKELDKNLAFLSSYKKVMDAGSIVSKSDINGKITYANRNFIKISGYTSKELIGSPHSLVRHPDTPTETFKELWTTIKNKKMWKGILKNKRKDGTHYWVEIVIKPILDENDEITEFIAVRTDITELIEQREELKRTTNIDKLTGLYSRFKLLSDLEETTQPSLAFLNIDNFRQVNDFYGHYFGDLLIKEISKALFELSKKNKHIKLYRTQADEFAILAQLSEDYEKSTFYSNILVMLKKINNHHIEIQKEEISINLTAAISYEDKDILLSTANMALKEAKRQKLELVTYKDSYSMDKQYEDNIKWTIKLKNAINDDRIVPFFQPIVNNKTGEFEKYESLVRLIDEENKVISPFFFLDIAKQTRYYNTLTKIMIEKSFERFKDETHEFSINLTVDDILNKEIKTYILKMLKKYDISKRVVFEIVESESIENFEKVSKFIEEVKSKGCKIAIDDFGTGYSNFEYLMKLKADYIKIDGSMIKNIDTDENAKMVVATIVDFAKKMNMKTIAEFVENEKILDVVNELGIDYSQGYHFSAPKDSLQ